MQQTIIWATLLVALVFVVPLLISRILRTVDAGTIRIVSWITGKTHVYRGPGKSMEIPLLTTGTTLPS